MDLELLTQIAPSNKVNTKQLLQMSDTFTKTLKTKPPTIENWITAKSDDLETLTQCANDSYPILHENVLLLCQDFLRFKLEQGTPIEKNLYEKLNLITFIDRLIKKVTMIQSRGCQFGDCVQTPPRKIILCSINWGIQWTMEISSND